MSITRRTRRLLSATAVVPAALAAPFAVPLTASAAPAPPAPPELTVAQSWMFRVGCQVDKAAAIRQNSYDLSVFHQQVPVAVVWQGRSRVGIDHYDLYRYNYQGSPIVPVLTGTHRTSYPTVHTDVHGAFGPITRSLRPTFNVAATDRLGQVTRVDGNRRSPVEYEQENGTTYADGTGGSRVFPAKPVAGPGWRTLRGGDYDGGTVLATSRRGAQIRIPINTYHTMQVALEMTTGPRLGSVEVRIDGRRAGTIDTSARTTRARVLVAQYQLEAGAHTVTLVNRGVGSHAMVQLDGVFVSD